MLLCSRQDQYKAYQGAGALVIKAWVRFEDDSSDEKTPLNEDYDLANRRELHYHLN